MAKGLREVLVNNNNNNNIPLIQSSHNTRQHRLGIRLSRTTAVHKLGLGCQYRLESRGYRVALFA